MTLCDKVCLMATYVYTFSSINKTDTHIFAWYNRNIMVLSLHVNTLQPLIAVTYMYMYMYLYIHYVYIYIITIRNKQMSTELL